MRVFCITIITLLCTIGVPTLVTAQQLGNPTLSPQSQGTLSLNVSPQHPEPGESVSLELTGYSTDLSRAEITWLIDGRRAAHGTGHRTLETEVAENGDVTTITAVVQPENGRRIEVSHTIRPLSIDLIWEADTYTPPLYSGKPHYTGESAVRVVALPHFTTSSGTTLDPTSLFYQWEVGQDVIQSQSGQGRQVLTISPRRLTRPIDVTVRISSRSKEYAAEKTITLENTDPEVVVYPVDPVLGTMYSSAAESGITLTNDEITFRAVPYFFSLQAADSGRVAYQWFLNDDPIDNARSNVTFRNENNRSGTARVSVEAEHRDRLPQISNMSFPITFRSQ